MLYLCLRVLLVDGWCLEMVLVCCFVLVIWDFVVFEAVWDCALGFDLDVAC